MELLKQSTAATILVGPVLDSTGAAYTGMAIADFNLTKNGTTAAMAAAASVTHSHEGHYLLTFTTGNTDTLGRLAVSCNKSGYAMPPARFTVLAAAAFDTLVTNGTLASTTSGRTIVTDAAGLVDANAVKAGPSGSGTAQTAGDIFNAIQSRLPNAAPGGAGGLPTVDSDNNLIGGINGSVAGNVNGRILGTGGASFSAPGVWAVRDSAENAVALENSLTGMKTDGIATYDPSLHSLAKLYNALQTIASLVNGVPAALLATALDEDEVNPTIMGAFNAAFVQGFGRWAIVSNQLKLYNSNNVVVATFNLTPSAAAPTARVPA